MTRIARAGRLARFTAIAAMAGLSAGVLEGCVSLLPKTPPVQLYQFGRPPLPAAGATAWTGPGIGVALSGVTLPRAAVGDQLLTVTGDETAYLAGARWITPAIVMFQEDAERAFDAQRGPVRLVGRGNVATAAALLGLDVGGFEARYDNGATSPPTIVVSVRATLSRPDGQTLAVQTFTAREPAADNRIAPIAAAFDRATTQVLSQLVAWTNTAAPSAAIPPATATTVTRTTSQP